ncbi:MAG: HutD/Ves family protein [Burkholderiaceae bacterium]
MSVVSVRTDDLPPQPWKNGLGTTRELVAWPRGSAWQVRVSVADIAADAPFSAYPGVKRWFAVLQGAGVLLRIGDREHRVTRNDAPLAFEGAEPVDCRLIDGPTRDMNLMLRAADGRLELAIHGAVWQPATRLAGLFAVVPGECLAGAERFVLEEYSLLWFDPAPASLSFTADARPSGATGWWIAATPYEA